MVMTKIIKLFFQYYIYSLSRLNLNGAKVPILRGGWGRERWVILALTKVTGWGPGGTNNLTGNCNSM